MPLIRAPEVILPTSNRVLNALLNGENPERPGFLSRWTEPEGEALRAYLSRQAAERRQVGTVDVVTGRPALDETDFELPGPIPIRWGRTYAFADDCPGSVGTQWRHHYDYRLLVGRGNVTVFLPDGRKARFPDLKAAGVHFARPQQLTLRYDGHTYVLQDVQGCLYYFSRHVRNGFRLLDRIENHLGFTISFSYTGEGILERIIDSAGRVLTVLSDAAGRMTTLEINDSGGTLPLVRYRYDAGGNLAGVSNQPERFRLYEYEQGRLVRSSDYNGLNRYWQYEKAGGFRCVRFWSAGGSPDFQLAYGDRHTTATDSLGRTITWRFNADGQVTKRINPDESFRQFTYDTFGNPASETDETGNRTNYDYDESGNCWEITDPEGQIIRFGYDDAHRLCSVRLASGAEWCRQFDEYGRLTERVGPAGETLFFEWEKGRLVAVTDRRGRRHGLRYDRQHNIQVLSLPGGREYHWLYDRLGRLTASSDLAGNQTRYVYDRSGRLTEILEPDGAHLRMTFDGEGRMTRVQGRRRDIRIEYEATGKPAVRSENGTCLDFRYDTEGRLTGIRNPRKEVRAFRLNDLGQVTEERGFDAVIRKYGRDPVGRVGPVGFPDGKTATYVADRLGRVTEIQYADQMRENFRYNEDGFLVEAANVHSVVRLERSPDGLILRETLTTEGSEYEIRHEYDDRRNRLRLASSLGADIRYQRVRAGEVFRTTAGYWEAEFRYDLSGQEIERKLPGGLIGRQERNALGRVVRHSLLRGKSRVFRRQYQWLPGGRLGQVVDEVGKTVTSFGYDAFGRLESETSGASTVLNYFRDEVGQMYGTKDRKDRRYLPGGWMIENRGCRYTFDARGRQVGRLHRDKKAKWQYVWNENDSLKAVIRPDGEEIGFRYDALGRRIVKSSGGRVVRYVWEGDRLLHEWTQGSRPTTWVYEPDSGIPMAGLIDGRAYSILTDYRGCPQQAYDVGGRKVWELGLTAYGVVGRRLNEHLIPFRLPGHYHDRETGLDYDGSRYYHPENARYLSPDPAGLKGCLDPYGYLPDPYRLPDRRPGLNGYSTF
ncbi:DUF6531 domain-containing protein [Larkinella soli]|uniref:DUF6531 domain-containing protein n=1 Tax=Larkinella soli TaxID=1770527 RepID=UPI0013E315CC|nr:DUF6531 domain-containing protein [Larkinella soli]